jgi:hypothetical protein
MKKTGTKPGEITYELDITADKVPYATRVTPFMFNDQKRFRISVNGGDEHIFAWDPEVVQLRPLDDDAAIFPEDFIIELSDRLVKTVVV